MGGGGSKCKYNRGWNKDNACPPGFKVVEDCGRWSSSISCKAPSSGFDSRAIPAGSGTAVTGSCTSDSRNPASGGTVPSASSCPSGYTFASSRYTPCCDNLASTCLESAAFGWSTVVTCTQTNGDMVFDTHGAYSCVDKHNGVSTNFPAQSWCKNPGMDACWLPYSMQSDGKCFPYGDMQWDSTSGYSAKSQLVDGNEKLLDGKSPGTMSAGGPSSPPEVDYNSGSIAGVASGGFACVVGVGALLRKKQKKRSAGNAADIELKDGSNTV
eukprot:CAMPEP_0118647624 /NCGR_PEP_ID=MMETSP0785-20121206/8710_1 /TAXON_ID=91992 /ORGANISM="Bolidomonas pacifica, Strain CCMP 1866" /LENGTH=268 /DNA_ID=CAMNT_0006539739 /DNA_START=19 /DNA_END=825 /DNA_ORIENTATION=-